MKTIMAPEFSQPQLAVKFVDAEYAAGQAGAIEGWASTFGGPPDRVGDVVMKGAFGEAPFTVPLLAYHDAQKPIGQATITPKDEGAWLSATLANTPFAQEMRELVKAGAVPSLSIGYQTKASEPNDFGGEDLYKVELMEVSLVPIPANPRALINSAKAFAMTHATGANVTIDGEPAMAKAGRRNSNKDQGALDAAHDAIVTAGATCPAVPDSEAKAAEYVDVSVDISLLELEADEL